MKALRQAPARGPCGGMRAQRGAALLTAMIIVTLVATLATAMVWQQWRAVQVESAERARAQAAWMLEGGFELALLTLREDKNLWTSLSDPWATPLKEARLSTFLATDKSNADDGPEAFISGYIEDAQGRYNVGNLVGTTAPFDLVAVEVKAFAELCTAIGVEASVAQRIATQLQAARRGSTNAPLLPRSLAQLKWLGIDDSVIASLEPYAVFIPAAGPVALDVNTASSKLLEAIAGVPSGTSSQLETAAKANAFHAKADFYKAAGVTPPAAEASAPAIGVKSDYFEVHGTLRLSDRILKERRLVHRVSRQFDVLQIERESIVEPSTK